MQFDFSQVKSILQQEGDAISKFGAVLTDLIGKVKQIPVGDPAETQKAIDDLTSTATAQRDEILQLLQTATDADGASSSSAQTGNSGTGAQTAGS